MNINDMYDGYREILLNSTPPETMIIAYPEGTWFLSWGNEPVLLGTEKEFDSIWQDVLLRH